MRRIDESCGFSGFCVGICKLFSHRLGNLLTHFEQGDGGINYGVYCGYLVGAFVCAHNYYSWGVAVGVDVGAIRCFKAARA